jgi:ElaB/YqjD/DUF883 family membrane-anchored ribosome-binding protein
MASESEVKELHHEIDETRANLASKLETLEEKVTETVRSTAENVEETIENVTSSVQETVTQVKRTFDLEHQMQERPWVLIGGAALGGFLVGSYFARRPQYGPWQAPPGRAAAAYTAGRPEAARPGFMEGLMNQFGDELGMVKELAIGYLAGVARDLIKEAAPNLGQQVQEIMDSATTKLGGRPVQGPVFGPTAEAEQRTV